MRVPFFQVDAFTTETFRGNPAAVCVLDRWPDDELLLAIAAVATWTAHKQLLRRLRIVEVDRLRTYAEPTGTERFG